MNARRTWPCLIVGGCALALATALASEHARAERAASAHHASITDELDCGACHTAAGWKTVSDGAEGAGFDHARTGFPLSGRHAHAACTQCHRPDQQVTRACNGCHRDSHERRLGQECHECHSAQSWSDVRAIELHRRTRLPLSGMHLLADCTDCHRRTSEQQWSSVPADCYACHAGDYARPNLHPSHVGSAAMPAFPRDCAQCHRATGWSPAVISAKGLGPGITTGALSAGHAPARHEALFPIASGAHRGSTCEDCHASDQLPKLVRCTGCHSHNPVTLRKLHRHTPASLADGACLGCHAGGQRR